MDALFLFGETRLGFFECPKEAATNHPSIRDLGPHEKPITLGPCSLKRTLPFGVGVKYRRLARWFSSASRAHISEELVRLLLLLQPVLQNCLLFNTPPVNVTSKEAQILNKRNMYTECVCTDPVLAEIAQNNSISWRGAERAWGVTGSR